MAFLNEPQRAAVSNAIRNAEARTSGEIVTVVAAQSDDHLVVVTLAAALVALIVPGALAPFVHIVAAGNLFFLQLAGFVAIFGLMTIRPLRFALLPAALKRAQAERLARAQFFARGLHLTEGRTGVLIFVSVAERYVEILADAGINEKVAPEAWHGIVQGFVTRVRRGEVSRGFVDAVEAVGAILATHFPVPARNPNELPDHLYVI